MADIVLLIERVGDDLEVSVESDTPATDNQKARRGEPIEASPTGEAGKSRNRKYIESSTQRVVTPMTISARGAHQTMILVDKRGDRVTFKCAKAFVVDVEFDPAYRDSHEPEPRRSPFLGWDNPQTGKQEGGAGPFLVTGGIH